MATCYSSRFDAALSFAAEKHEGQHRKGTATPYLVHPVQVARLLEVYGFDEEVVCAGLLHDTLEDTGATRDELQKLFGESIARIVVECSEPDKSKPWEVRKEEAIGRMEKMTRSARAVACADKAHNLHTVADALERGESVWRRFRRGRGPQLDYHRRALDALATRFDHPILHELASALARVEVCAEEKGE